jgi:hypothetical protein
MDIWDVRNWAGRGAPLDELADFLCRDVAEVRAKAAELGLDVGGKSAAPTGRS